jgi:hypothetical protein
MKGDGNERVHGLLPLREKVPEGRMRADPPPPNGPHPALRATLSRKGRGDEMLEVRRA